MGGSDFRHAAEAIRSDIERRLTSCGILCRVFGRGKDVASLSSKLAALDDDGETPKYSLGDKMVQDAIGIRVVLYFSDDIDIAREILCASYVFHEGSSAIDRPNNAEFAVTRYNLIFDVPDLYKTDVLRSIAGRPIDSTFETQVRSVLSEGWHEVEHDLRYKQKQHWVGNEDLSRALNGIVAALETSEWGMRKIFDDLAYRQYKGGNWDAMLTLKMRMRVVGELDPSIKVVFDSDNDVAKKMLRIDRASFLIAYAERFMAVPLTLSNVVYVMNAISEISVKITSITPARVLRLAS